MATLAPFTGIYGAASTPAAGLAASAVGAGGAAASGLMAAMGPVGWVGLGLSALGLFGKKKKVSAPPPRSYLGEMSEALDAQRSILPRIEEGEIAAQDVYGALQERSMMGQLGVLQNLYGAYAPAGAEMAAYNLDTFAPMYGAAAQYATGTMRQGIGAPGMSLLDTMTGQAQEGLNAGQNMTAADLAFAQQGSRAANAARGLNMSGMGIANEILNTFKMRTAREDRARQYAQSVFGLNQGIATLGQQLYGQPITALASAMSPTTLMGQATGFINAQGPQFMQPESQYMANVKGANQNAQLQTNMANAQISAGRQAGLMSMLGSIGGGVMGGIGQAGGISNYFS